MYCIYYEDPRYKFQDPSMSEEKKVYDLEERTLLFSKRIITLVNALPKNDVNKVLIGQCLRAGASVGSNYREAGDALGDKDFLFRMRISRKEAKETFYWLQLIAMSNIHLQKRMEALLQENQELIKILSKIISNRGKKAVNGFGS